jgi:hypothetical protein|tara:strand:+ start:1015 stop:1857 length:843 start_codon:yes stop_codon:yes gene_type:complete
MGVGGGAGNAISFSELQTYYGGSNPISLSEYYRNGTLVPGDQVSAQSNTDGTGSQTIGEFGVAVSSAFTGTLNSSVMYVNTQVSGGVSYTITADDAVVNLIGAHPSGASEENPTGTWRVMRSSSAIIGPTTLSASGGEGDSSYFGSRGSSQYHANIKGPAYQSGDEGTGLTGNLLSSTATQAGDVVETTSHTYAARVSTRRRDSEFDVDFTNNGSVTITTTSGSTGGAQSYTAGQTRKVKDDQSTANYTLGYDAVLGNTNVPASGTINMNVFNAPGTATP